jgi:hypothetical protein
MFESIAQRYALGPAETGEGSMTKAAKIISTLVAFSAAASSTAFAENCRAIPIGPERRDRGKEAFA